MNHRKDFLAMFAILIAGTLAAPSVWADVIHVDAGAIGDNDGVSTQNIQFSPADEQGRFVHLIEFAEPGMLSAVSRSLAPGERFDANSPAALAQRDFLMTRQAEWIQDMAAAIWRPLEVSHYYLVSHSGLATRLAPEEAETIRALPGVVSVQRERVYELLTYRGPTFIGADTIWDGSAVPGGSGFRGEGLVAAILDTGIPANPDIHASFVNDPACGHGQGGVPDKVLSSLDCGATDGTGLCNGPSPGDTNGHGSHTASTVAGNLIDESAIPSPNIPGDFTQMSGVAPCAHIRAYKVCPTNNCFEADIQAGMDSVLLQLDEDLPIVAMNFSIGGGADPWNDNDRRKLDIVDAGVFVATSAGNTSLTTPNPVGQVNHHGPWVMSVAASTRDTNQQGGTAQGDVLAGFSFRGPTPAPLQDLQKPDITAPGSQIPENLAGIYAAVPGGYTFYSGTSMSSPHVAGAGLLIAQAHPDWTPSEIKSALQMTAFTGGFKENGSTPWDWDDVGSGRADLTQAALAGLVMDETTFNYIEANPSGGSIDVKDLNLAGVRNRDCSLSCSWTRTVRNTLGLAADWTASGNAFTPGFLVSIDPPSFNIAPGATQDITITVQPVTDLTGALAFGEVVLSEDGGLSPDLHITVAIEGEAPPLEPTIVPDPGSLDVSMQPGQSTVEVLNIGNAGLEALDWSIDEAETEGVFVIRSHDPVLDEAFDLPDFMLDSLANGGSPESFTVPAGVLTQGDVVGFSFVGTVAGIGSSGSWASDLCMFVEAPDGSTFTVGGFTGNGLTGCLDNVWDFDGGGSSGDGTYESFHEDIFDPAVGGQGDWTFSFVNDFNSGTAATMSWTDVTVTLHKSGGNGGGVGCDNPTDIPWLSVSPDNGTTPPTDSVPVVVTMDAESLAIGLHQALLCIASNDPANPLIIVPVNLTIDPPAPIADISPNSFAFMLDIGQTDSDTLFVGNLGTVDLDWSITTDMEGLAGVRSHDPALDEAFDLPDFMIDSLANGGSPESFTVPAGVLTQGDVVGFSFIGTVTGILGTTNWASDMCMFIEAPDGTTFTVGGFTGDGLPGCAENAWDFDGSGSTGDGTYASVHDDVFPGVVDEGVWTFSFINDWNVAAAPTMSWTDVTVTLHKVPLPFCDDITAVDWLSVAPASGTTAPSATDDVGVLVDTAGLTAGTYRAALCVTTNDPAAGLVVVPVSLSVIATGIDVDPTSLSSTLQPDQMDPQALTISNLGEALLEWEVTEAGRVVSGGTVESAGRTAGSLDCTLPDWITVDPLSGEVLPDGSQVVDVTFDATGLAPGDFSATLCISSNYPATPLVTVPLNLTVEPLTLITEIAGQVTDADTSAPLEGVQVVIDNPAPPPDNYTAETDASGNYSRDVGEADGYTVTFSRFGYETEIVTDVDVEEGMTTTVNVALAPADNFTVSGTVMDSITLEPLTATIEIEGVPLPPIAVGPDGQYSVDLPSGATYDFITTAAAQGYLVSEEEVGPLAGNIIFDILVDADLVACEASGYTPITELFYSEDFDADDGGFTAAGPAPLPWQWGTPTIWPTGCTVGDNCWATNLSGQYATNGNETLSSPVIDLSAAGGAEALFLRWDQATDIGQPLFDQAFAEVSIDGGPWTVLWQNETSVGEDWRELEFDITAAAGQEVELRWRMTTSGFATAMGLYIDNIRIVAEECVAGAPIADITPASFNFTVDQDDSDTDTLNIGNIGDLTLEWTITQVGASGCNNPDVVSWLSVDPDSGTTTGGDFTDVEVEVDSTGLAEGIYEALLCVSSNDPVNDLVPVPVTLTVIDPTAGTLEGTVTSAGHCSADPHPIEGAEISVPGYGPVFTEAGGSYSMRISEDDSPVDVTVTAGGYLDDSATGVVITAGMTTVQDFDLVLDAPCATADPNSFSFELPQDSTGTQVLAIGNVDGVAALDWDLLGAVGLATSGQVIWHQAQDMTAGDGEPPRGGGLIWDQDIGGAQGIISAFGNPQNAGVYSSDDFLISSDQFIAEIFTPGFYPAGSLTTNATEITWVIYPDGGGRPAGHPEDGGGNEVWTLTLPIGDPALDITDEDISLDVVAAQGESIALGAGRFWLVVYPSLNVANITLPATRWNWNQGVPQEEPSKLIDPQGLFAGAIAPDWTNFADLGVAWTDMAFTLTGGPPPPDCWDPATTDWLDVVPSAGTVDAGATQAVDVIADSSGLAPGDYEITLCLNNSDDNAGRIFIPVELTVLDQEPAELAVDPAALEFGEVPIDDSATMSFEVLNNAAAGDADLTLTAITPAGDAEFSISGGTCMVGGTVAPQGSCTVEVTFAPGAEGAFSGDVTVEGNDQAATVDLTGTGGEPEDDIFSDRFEEDSEG